MYTLRAVIVKHIKYILFVLGYLVTTALRPPLTYGEGDNHFMPSVLKYLANHGYQYPRIAGAGGKQQLVYAGNFPVTLITHFFNEHFWGW